MYANRGHLEANRTSLRRPRRDHIPRVLPTAGLRNTGVRGRGYGFVTRDGIEIHLGQLPEGDPRAIRSTAYIWVEDADETAQAWRSAGADVRPPEDTDWGQHEDVLMDPDGNIIRFGSPTAGATPAR